MSIPERAETRVSCGESIENWRIVTPRAAKDALAALETEPGRVKVIMLLGGREYWESESSSALTTEEPV